MALNDARIPDENTLELSYRITLSKEMKNMRNKENNLDQASNFDFDGISIEYAVDLPKNFDPLNDETIKGETMQCFSRENENVVFLDRIYFKVIF